MKLRLTHTKRKDYKTSQALDNHNLPYLFWEVFPTDLDLANVESHKGLQIWIAGASSADKWFIKETHTPGSPGFAEGGYTAINNHAEVTYILPKQAILHPTALTKKKKKKTK
jgi:hypothetical protein